MWNKIEQNLRLPQFICSWAAHFYCVLCSLRAGTLLFWTFVYAVKYVEYLWMYCTNLRLNNNVTVSRNCVLFVTNVQCNPALNLDLFSTSILPRIAPNYQCISQRAIHGRCYFVVNLRWMAVPSNYGFTVVSVWPWNLNNFKCSNEASTDFV